MPKMMKQDGKPLKMTFADEFNDQSLSHWDGHGSDGLWATSFSPHLENARTLTSNGEGQVYIDPSDSTMPNPFSMEDGVLAIRATELTEQQSTEMGGQQYGSGLITTEMTLHTESGYIEVSAQVPDQQGFLSAFWLIPADGEWSSEIDGFEILGHDTDRLNTNYWIDGEPHEGPIQTTDLSDGFHTYGIAWDEDSITWYLDGEVVRVAEASITEPMQLAISLAVDTNWTGSPDETTDFNDALLIDYVRVYEPMSSSNPGINNQSEFVAQVDDVFRIDDTTLSGSEFRDVMQGDKRDEVFYGKDGNDAINGDRGDDKLFGHQGNDILVGGRGEDKLIGGDGNDVLIGGRGDDHMWGDNYGSGSGNDSFVFEKHAGKDWVHDFDIEDDVIDLRAFNVTYEDIMAATTVHSWATEIDLGELGGTHKDVVTILNIDGNALTEDNFLF